MDLLPLDEVQKNPDAPLPKDHVAVLAHLLSYTSEMLMEVYIPEGARL